ncbi:MAG: conjugal transfer protein TraC, partial [Actinomycetota bacterium]|nr:conjugal transfer protein TraC [Actinomycetota bacterium]
MTSLFARIPRPATRPASPFGPDGVEVGSRALRVGDGWCASFAITGYPREVGYGWLEPLTAHPGRLDVAVHVEPVPANLAADRLRRQLARLESGRRADMAKGRLADPDVEVAASDARELAAGLARGEQKLFRVGLYLTVHAGSEKALEAERTRVRALCASMLLDAQPATWRTLQGWISTLPVGVDALGQRRSFDTDALAASFPFASAELSATTGVLYGTTTNGSGLLCWDRFAMDNHNSVILARSGAGKSYLAKLEALRSLYQGIEIAVVDPEDEYRRLAETAGGAYVHLGAPGIRLNPFDLPPGPEAAAPDALVRRALFVHTLIAVLLREKPDPAATAALDRGIICAYEAVGITADPRSHARPAPLLADLAAALGADGDPAARTLSARLAPFVTGTHRGLFDGP